MKSRDLTPRWNPRLGALAPWRELPLLIGLALTWCLAGNAHGQNWDRFRGPNGAGQSDAPSIPVQWEATNYLWSRPLPGSGHSSPVVWGERLFITSADPQTGQQIVTAVDAFSGHPLWDTRLEGATYAMHAHNSYASSTPAVDAERLYVLWRAGTKIQLIGLTHDGDEAWRCDVAESDEKHGFGASPVLVDGLVLVINDNEKASTLTAVEAATGDVRWQVPRPSGQSAFATPCLLETASGKKLLVAASTAAGLTAIDPADGHTVWQALEDDLPQRCVSSPIVAGGLALVSCGLANNGLHLIAVRPGDEGARPMEAYRIDEGVPNVTTPVVAGDLLFLWHDQGTVSCHDLATGRRHWRRRIGGNFHSSPIRVGDRIYCASREGEMFVLAADRSYRLLARNALGEPCDATPAVAHSRMYVRTESTLICIGQAASAGAMRNDE